MTCYEIYSLIIQAVGVFVAILVVIAAIWGEKIRQIWTAPKLKMIYQEMSLTKTNDGKFGWYFILKIFNENKASPAENTQVQLLKIFRYENEKWMEDKFSSPIQIKWRWHATSPQFQTIGPSSQCTFLNFPEGGSLQLTPYFYPNNFNPNINPNQKTRLVLETVSNKASTGLFGLEIYWNGKWDEEHKKIEKNIRIEKWVV